MNGLTLHHNEEGATEAVILHHEAYYRDRWGFDCRFAEQVGQELGEYLGRFDPALDSYWWAEMDGQFAGAVYVDGTQTLGEARLRWFIVPEGFQGAGLGAALLATALEFCRTRRFSTVYLWTFAGLDAARKLYERNGFVLCEERPHEGWGPKVTAQKFEWKP
ncbi:GNAT family N-acetyltransferase [Pseudodesulfovibrio cashew]|uniref:GNAT family N-acetyltransferase n=1 Tax=Pseudodesulfovibrio cashew TaxID=2678688 RepID=A0A6I6JH43_9BACT|nr:GNAT family N-acetyltransferase [Pseudodesulfovibrio cashew]QGY39397.1 GNAT family N-acetyltransferase [Pseudodesulfovibrio cashew]